MLCLFGLSLSAWILSYFGINQNSIKDMHQNFLSQYRSEICMPAHQFPNVRKKNESNKRKKSPLLKSLELVNVNKKLW
jgi:hypothetical protein